MALLSFFNNRKEDVDADIRKLISNRTVGALSTVIACARGKQKSYDAQWKRELIRYCDSIISCVHFSKRPIGEKELIAILTEDETVRLACEKYAKEWSDGIDDETMAYLSWFIDDLAASVFNEFSSAACSDLICSLP